MASSSIPPGNRPFPIAERPFLTAREVSALTGFSEQTLAHWRSGRKSKGPKFLKIGRAVRYERRIVEEWLRRHAV